MKGLFSEEIQKGLLKLLEMRNADFGWPAVKPTDMSGLWSTGEIVYVISKVGESPDLEKIVPSVNFILKKQLPDGSWPIIQTPPGSVLSTSDCVIAFGNIFDKPVFSDLKEDIIKSINQGCNWLISSRNLDGGWGIEQTSEESGKSRVLSTYYAIRALISVKSLSIKLEKIAEINNCIEGGLNYLINTKNKDGSWGYQKNVPGDASNTARAIITLLESHKYTKDAKEIINGRNYILSKYNHNNFGEYDKNCLWENTEERILRSQGLLLLDGFTTYDCVRALLYSDYLDLPTLNSFKWFLETQEDGAWCLQCPVKKEIKDCKTWVTAEVIFVLSLGTDFLIGDEKHQRRLLELVFSLSGIQNHEIPLGKVPGEKILDLNEMVIFLEIPHKIFVSFGKKIVDIIGIVFSFGLVMLLLYYINHFIQGILKVEQLRLIVFVLFTIISLFWLCYARVGRVAEVQNMEFLKFLGLIGGVVVGIAVLAQLIG